MAKVNIKSEKNTTFGEIFFVLDKFDYILSCESYRCLCRLSDQTPGIPSSHGTITHMKQSEPRLAIKLSPERNEELREHFTAVTPAWHWNKKHWSDVYYEQLDDLQVQEWIRESYTLVASKLP